MTSIDSPHLAAGNAAGWTSESFLEKVTGVVPSIIYVFNQQTQSNEYTNRNMAEFLGYESDEIREMGDEMMPRLCHPDDLGRVGAHFETIRGLEDGEIAQIDYRMRHKNGNWTWLVSQDTVFDRHADGSVVRHVGAAADITEQKRAEAAAHEASVLLQRLNGELTELAYVASHELASPVANIAGLVDLLAERLPDDDSEAAGLHQLIVSSCELVSSRIQAISRVTKDGAIGLARSTALVALEALTAEVVNSVRVQLDAVGGRVDIDIEGIAVPFDELGLRSIFENLIVNSTKYADPARSLVIEISGRVAGPDVVVTVADNGRGLDPDTDADRLFGLFKRGQNHDEPGSGVGLYLVRQMMSRAGGSVSVEPSPTGGALFTLTFQRDSSPLTDGGSQTS